jgi:nitroreductase/NAD-dependent dihydropyrimidine dehydrogenase PreA subunit
MPELSVNDQNCTRCGLCASACPMGIIKLPEGELPRYVADGPDRCIICGHCEAVCPSNAIQVDDPRLAPTSFDETSEKMDPAHLGAYLRMRRSIRRYRQEPVERSVIERLMDIVRYAPTGTNSQLVRWLIIHDTQELRRLTALAVDWMRAMVASESPMNGYFNFEGMIRAWEKGNDPICRLAPHLAIAYTHKDTLTARTDAIIALSHLEIAAPSFCLGACWGGFFQFAATSWEPLQAALQLPPDHLPAYAMMFGYPAFPYQRPPRRNPVNILWR